MNESRDSNPIRQTLSDFGISIKLLFQNFKPFFIVLLIGTIIYYGMDVFFRYYLFEKIIDSIPNDPTAVINLHSLAYSLFKLPSDSFLFGFFGSAMGLGYDIMSSGDGFTEVRNSLYYIRKFWLKFFVFGFISNFIIYLLRLINPFYISDEISIVSRIFGAVWFVSGQ